MGISKLTFKSFKQFQGLWQIIDQGNDQKGHSGLRTEALDGTVKKKMCVIVPDNIDNVVVLPAPFVPKKPKHSPSWTENDKELTATFAF